jgi:hypothetical protein
MATINEYLETPWQARADAVNDEILRTFILPDDIETIAVSQGGVQYQVQALKVASIDAVISRATAMLQKVGVDFRTLVCSPQEFNFCGALKNSAPAVVLQALDTFLKNRILSLGLTGFGVVGILTTGPFIVALGKFITILLALAHLRRELERLCQCT